MKVSFIRKPGRVRENKKRTIGLIKISLFACIVDLSKIRALVHEIREEKDTHTIVTAVKALKLVIRAHFSCEGLSS